jgi:hypothetical protein
MYIDYGEHGHTWGVMGMSELAKSNMSPVLPRLQEVYRQPEVMNGVVITYRICGELMRNCGCQAEQNRHINGWKKTKKYYCKSPP